MKNNTIFYLNVSQLRTTLHLVPMSLSFLYTTQTGELGEWFKPTVY